MIVLPVRMVAQHRDRIVEQEIGQVAQHPLHDHAAVQATRESHGTRAGNCNEQDNQVDRDDKQDARHIIEHKELAAVHRERMKKVNLPAVVQIAEERHAAQDGQHDKHQLDKWVVQR